MSPDLDDDAILEASLLDLERVRNPALLDLLVPLSLAIRAELELVRAIRHELLPGSDPALEADLWASPVLQAADVSAVVLLPEVRTKLHAELAANRALLESAWAIVEEHHQNLDAVILLEERATYFTLRGEMDLAQQQLGHVLKSLEATPNDPDLLRWTKRFLPRLPERAKGTEAAIKLRGEVAGQTGRNPAGGIPKLASGQDLLAHAGTVTLGIRRTPDGVWITCPPESKSIPFEAPHTDPVRLDLAWPTAEGWHEEVNNLAPRPTAEASEIEIETEREPSLQPHFLPTPLGQLRLRTVDQREARLHPPGPRPLLCVFPDQETSDLPLNLQRTLHDLGWRYELSGDETSSARRRPVVLILGLDPSSDFPIETLELQIDVIGFDVRHLDADPMNRRDRSPLQNALETATAVVTLIDPSSFDSEFFLDEFQAVSRWSRETKNVLHLPVAVSREAMMRAKRSKLVMTAQLLKPGPPKRTIDQIRQSLTSHLETLRKKKIPTRFPAANEDAAATLLLLNSPERIHTLADSLRAQRSDLPAELKHALVHDQPILVSIPAAVGAPPRTTRLAPTDSSPRKSGQRIVNLLQSLQDPGSLDPRPTLRSFLIDIERELEQQRLDQVLANRFTPTSGEANRITNSLVTINGQPGFLFEQGFAGRSVRPDRSPPQSVDISAQGHKLLGTLYRNDDRIALYKLIDPPPDLPYLDLAPANPEREDRWTSVVHLDQESSITAAGVVRDADVHDLAGVSLTLAFRLPKDAGITEDTQVLAPLVCDGKLAGLLTRIIPGSDPGGEGDLAHAISISKLRELLEPPHRIEYVEWDKYRPEGVWGPIDEHFLDNELDRDSPSAENEVRWGVGTPDGNQFQLLYWRKTLARDSQSTASTSRTFPPNDATRILQELLPSASESEIGVITRAFLQTKPEIPNAHLPRLEAFANSITDPSGPIVPGLRRRILGVEPPLDPDHKRQGHAGTIRSLAITPDGHLAITAGNSEPDRSVKIWDLRTGKLLHSLDDQAEGGGRTALALSPDGTRALTSFGHDLRLWDVADGKQLGEWSIKFSNAPVRDAAFAGEHHLLATTADVAALVDVKSGQVEPLGSGGDGHVAVAATDRGGLLALLRSDGLTVWQNHEGPVQIMDHTVRTLGHDALQFQRPALRFTPDGALLFGSPLTIWTEHQGVQGGEGSPRFAVADYAWDGTAIQILSSASFQVVDRDGKPLTPELQCGGREISCAALSADGTTVLAADYDHHLWIWWLGEARTEPVEHPA